MYDSFYFYISFILYIIFLVNSIIGLRAFLKPLKLTETKGINILGKLP